MLPLNSLVEARANRTLRDVMIVYAGWVVREWRQVFLLSVIIVIVTLVSSRRSLKVSVVDPNQRNPLMNFFHKKSFVLQLLQNRGTVF